MTEWSALSYVNLCARLLCSVCNNINIQHRGKPNACMIYSSVTPVLTVCATFACLDAFVPELFFCVLYT